MCPRPKLKTKLRSAADDETNSSASSDGKKKWAYAVARGKDGPGVWFKWFGEVEPMVIGFAGAIHKKFRSTQVVTEFVERMKLQSSP